MGLKLTLPKNANRLYVDFVDAYWYIDTISYSVDYLWYQLSCFPSREARYKHNKEMENPTIGVGDVTPPIYDTQLYHFEGIVKISDVFPEGIPLDVNSQKSAIYSYIKDTVSLPFEDVFEGDQA